MKNRLMLGLLQRIPLRAILLIDCRDMGLLRKYW